MTAVPAKIVLKSTTKVTLSDRFTQIQKMRPPPPSPQEVRAQIAASQQSTQQNRRLAQQMANRPAVQAALGGGGGGAVIIQAGQRKQQQHLQQPKSLKQRLGPTNIKARLSLGNQIQRGRGRGLRRGGFRGRGQQQNGVMQSNRGDRGGMRGRGFGTRGRGTYTSSRWLDDRRQRGQDWYTRQGDSSYQFRGGRGGRGQRGGGDRGFTRSPRGGARGRGFRGAGRGRGQRGGGRGGGSMSKEALDNQLEEYMSKTKNHLDHELDQYMAEADS